MNIFIRTISDWMNNNALLDLNKILKMCEKYNHSIHMKREYLHLKCKIIKILEDNMSLKYYNNKIRLGTTWKYAKMSDKVRFVNPKKQ
jgi:hypothetical protein